MKPYPKGEYDLTQCSHPLKSHCSSFCYDGKEYFLSCALDCSYQKKKQKKSLDYFSICGSFWKLSQTEQQIFASLYPKIYQMNIKSDIRDKLHLQIDEILDQYFFFPKEDSK